MTLTLVAVYAPLAFTPGRTGRLFVEFALALAGAVVVSGFVALTLTPMMCSLLLKHNPKPGRFDRSMERVLVVVSEAYGRLLRWVVTARYGRNAQGQGGGGVAGALLQARWIVVAVMLVSAAAICWVFPTMKRELSPLEDRGVILANVTAPDGATLEYTNRYAQALERIGQPYKEFDRIFANVGNPTVAQASVVYRDGGLGGPQEDHAGAGARDAAARSMRCPGVTAFPITPPSLGQGFRERPVNFVIQTSDSYQNLNAVVRQMMDEIAKNPGIVSPDVDLRLNKPELAHRGGARQGGRPGRERGSGGQGHRNHAGRAQRHALQARRRAVRRDRADRWPAAAPRPRTSSSIYVRGRNDTMIPLSALVTVRESVAPRELNHFGQRRSVSITANLAPDYSLGRGADLPEPDSDQGAQAGLHHRPERHLARVQQLAGRAGHRVRAGAAVHLPGAGGAVRELRRSVGHHAVGAAVDDRRAAGAQMVGRLAQCVFADRPDHAGGPDHQARHPDRRVHQPAARAGHGDDARRWSRPSTPAPAPDPDDHRCHGAGRRAAGACPPARAPRAASRSAG